MGHTQQVIGAIVWPVVVSESAYRDLTGSRAAAAQGYVLSNATWFNVFNSNVQ